VRRPGRARIAPCARARVRTHALTHTLARTRAHAVTTLLPSPCIASRSTAPSCCEARLGVITLSASLRDGMQGELICCDGAKCDRIYHLECVGLMAAPNGDWHAALRPGPHAPSACSVD
jgi:hypothetical protein